MKGIPLVIGMGGIGRPLYEIVRGVYPKAEWLDLEPREIGKEISVMQSVSVIVKILWMRLFIT